MVVTDDPRPNHSSRLQGRKSAVGLKGDEHGSRALSPRDSLPPRIKSPSGKTNGSRPGPRHAFGESDAAFAAKGGAAGWSISKKALTRKDGPQAGALEGLVFCPAAWCKRLPGPERQAMNRDSGNAPLSLNTTSAGGRGLFLRVGGTTRHVRSPRGGVAISLC